MKITVLHKPFIIFLLILLIFNSLFFIQPNKVNAAGGKIATEIVKRSAKESIQFVIERKAKTTINSSVSKQVTSETAERYIQREGKTLFHPDNSGKVYEMVRPSSMTNTQQASLNKAIDNQIQKRITGGRKWNLFENVVDLFTGYQFWLSVPTVLSLTLSSSSESELDNIAFDALIESGLMYPAELKPTELRYKEPFTVVTPKWDDNDYLTYDYFQYDIDDNSQILNADNGDEIEKDKFNNEIEEDESFKTFYISDFIFDNGDFNNKMLLFNSDRNFFIDNTRDFGITLIGNNYQNYNEITMESYDDYDELIINLMGNFFWDVNINDARVYRNGSNITNEVEIRELNFRFSMSKEERESINSFYIYIPYNNIGNWKIHFNTSKGYYTMTFNSTHDSKYIIDFGSFTLDGPANINYNQNINIRKINMNYVLNPFYPLPQKDDVSIEDGELQEGNTIHLPSPNVPKIKDKETGEELEFNEKDGGLIVVNPGTGEEVTDENIEIEIEMPGIEDIPSPNPDNPPIQEEQIPETDPPIDTEYPTYPDPNTPGEPTDPNNPNPSPGPGCDTLDIEFESMQTFTEKFPFSIPWDIYNAINALFGGMGSEKPEFEYILLDTKINIVIPKFIEDARPFMHGILILIFDIGVIYSLRKWFGGAS